MAVSAAAAISATGSLGNTPRQMLRDLSRADHHAHRIEVDSSDSEGDEFGLWEEADEAEAFPQKLIDDMGDRPTLVSSPISTVVGEVPSTAVSESNSSGSVVHDSHAVLAPPAFAHNEKYNVGSGNPKLLSPTPVSPMSALDRVRSSLNLFPAYQNDKPASPEERSRSSPGAETDSSLQADDVSIIDHDVVAQWLESHPSFPYYVAGGIDGSVQMFHFGMPGDAAALMATYRQAPAPRVTRIRFNGAGTKLGVVDMSGRLLLWRLDGLRQSLAPFREIQAHTKRALDFCWLNGGSFLASAGHSKDHRNVCLWDTLVKPSSSLVHALDCHHGGASAVVFSAKHQLIVTGGKRGDMHYWDLRSLGKPLYTEAKAHHSQNIKTLSIDASAKEDFVVSGSTDGAVKLWSLPECEPLHTWRDVHSKHTFVRRPGQGLFMAPVSTYGVMQVTSSASKIFTCGSDGSLFRFDFQRDYS